MASEEFSTWQRIRSYQMESGRFDVNSPNSISKSVAIAVDMAGKTSLLLLGGSVLPVWGETILGLTVFSRHGDRTSKHYSGYSLTNLGFQQNFQTGSFYRDLYLASGSSKQILGISEDKYVTSQIWASAPDQTVLANTATAFLQGLYPPLDQLDPQIATNTLNNGTKYTNPLNGYQYVQLHGPGTESPNTIWIKGDDGCPVATAAAASFETSEEFITRDAATKSFYQQFWPQISDVFDYEQSELGYARAYDIFDLINVAQIHNSSEAERVTAEQLFQLRTLADSAEFGGSFNASQPARSIGAQTLAGAILNQLNQTVTSKGKLKFSLLAGSYDTFLAFFGLTELTAVDSNFYGLPDYASTMAFEVLTDKNVDAFPSSVDDLKVRFLFRNGSDVSAPLTPFPLFGQQEQTLTWTDFVARVSKVAITSAEKWCSVCKSKQAFCAAYDPSLSSGSIGAQTTAGGSNMNTQMNMGGSGMSNAVAGVIGAMVTLGTVAVAGFLFYLLTRRRERVPAASCAKSIDSTEKGSLSLSSGTHA
ncbi:hypothetical protein Dda_1917 [Drechslerella dactyloides]|uniref:Phosphoglycerate mutase-like protein n=1 Tax=Drechslerella dactyloides TaxID=74499 RepID=A0AAD6J2J4_DREDA|nr:hypothetical protein Dda_1917 [Drechslerella dactyloides]